MDSPHRFWWWMAQHSEMGTEGDFLSGAESGIERIHTDQYASKEMPTAFSAPAYLLFCKARLDEPSSHTRSGEAGSSGAGKGGSSSSRTGSDETWLEIRIRKHSKDRTYYSVKEKGDEVDTMKSKWAEVRGGYT